MNQATLIRKVAIAADERLTSDRCLECFDTEHVLDDLFSHLIDFGMNQGDMIITADDITKG